MSIQKTKTNPFSVAPSPTHRVGLTEAEILELLTWLQDMKVTNGLSRLLASANLKLNNVYEKANIGNKLPDYVPTGKRLGSAINMDSLGVPAEEQKRYNNSPELSDDIWAQIAIDERKMLEEVAATGNKNVILSPAVPTDDVVLGSSDSDIGDDTRPTDNDSVHSLMMSLKTTDL
jgi:hypothetical protein